MDDLNNSIVNQRFCEVYKQLKTLSKIKNKSHLAEQLGTYNHVINNIMQGKRNLTLEQIDSLMNLYGVNANYLFGRSDAMFLGEEGNAASDAPLKITEKIFEGRNNITLVPQKALAGYALEASNQDYLSQFSRFSIPGLEGNLIAFEISGDSMLPNITNGDLVVCEPVERGEPLKDNGVYVIVTDTVVAKRIQQIKENNSLVRLRLLSDNFPTYQPYEVELNEVNQILRVKCRLTAHGIA